MIKLNSKQARRVAMVLREINVFSLLTKTEQELLDEIYSEYPKIKAEIIKRYGRVYGRL